MGAEIPGARDSLLAAVRARVQWFGEFQDEGAVQWMGHRPATPDSLPVIGKSPSAKSVIYAFGHGHLGLTQAATTGALVADLLVNRIPRTPLDEYSIGRFRK